MKRGYVSPLRTEGAAHTRQQILRAAKAGFEERGWAGTTLALIAASAQVSPKTVQAQFGTKAEVLRATVDHAIRGSSGDIGSRTSAGEILAATDASSALGLHAAMSTGINARAAALAGVVEAGAAADPVVGALWNQMRENMRFGVDWAARVVGAKPGVRPDLTRAEAQCAFGVAMAWGTYRVLSDAQGLGPDEIEQWIVDYYRRMLLP